MNSINPKDTKVSRILKALFAKVPVVITTVVPHQEPWTDFLARYIYSTYEGAMKKTGQFRSTLLHPRYWFTWFGLAVLWLLVQLPYPVLIRLGANAGKLSRHFLKRRERITRRNIELCFPHINEEEKEVMIAGNFESLGMALAETGIAWFWSDGGFVVCLTSAALLTCRMRRISSAALWLSACTLCRWSWAAALPVSVSQ